MSEMHQGQREIPGSVDRDYHRGSTLTNPNESATRPSKQPMVIQARRFPQIRSPCQPLNHRCTQLLGSPVANNFISILTSMGGSSECLRRTCRWLPVGSCLISCSPSSRQPVRHSSEIFAALGDRGMPCSKSSVRSSRR